MRWRDLTLFILVFGLAGCPGLGSSSRPYAPTPGSYEATIFPTARRDILPDDVRSNLKSYRSTTVLWTGIVQGSERRGRQLLTRFKHHYWDWIEDYSTQRQIAFLSPRGEGYFACLQNIDLHTKEKPMAMPQRGEMAVVYGTPVLIGSDGMVMLECLPAMRSLLPEKYATDIWDYGRDYLLKGDKSDLKVLRVPLYQ